MIEAFPQHVWLRSDVGRRDATATQLHSSKLPFRRVDLTLALVARLAQMLDRWTLMTFG
jgi:hypothetical protein